MKVSKRWLRISLSGYPIVAILNGRKTQMRAAIVKPEGGLVLADVLGRIGCNVDGPDGAYLWDFATYQVGERVHVVEPWRTPLRPTEPWRTPLRPTIQYQADEWVRTPDPWPSGSTNARWSSPRHMPRWASRLTLEILEVRLQRLHDITEADATAEGMIFTDYGRTVYGTPQPGWSEAPSSRSDQCHGSARAAFGDAFNRRHAGVDWNLRNGPSPWDRNPYVWAYTFKAHTGSTHGA